MLFMVEKGCTSRPFPFVCDFDGELGDLLGQCRRDEFKNLAAFQDPSLRARIPDPQSEGTSSLASWTEI